MNEYLTSLEHKLEPCEPEDIIGLAIKTIGQSPINGLRHKASNGACGWYIWCGEYSIADDFFKPVHLIHLEDYIPEILPYLSLPTGYRFLKANEYEDIWFDPEITSV